MAAITQIDDFAGTLTNWTVVEGTASNVNGELVPGSAATTTTVIYDPPFLETYNGTESVGVIFKFTLGGNCEPGSTVRYIYNYVDINNYRYIQAEFGFFPSPQFSDRVSLWKRVSGVDSELSTEPLKYRQRGRGDLRHFFLRAGSDLTIIKGRFNHMVRFSTLDSIAHHQFHAEDDILMQESDPSVPDLVTNGRMGIQFVGGSHANTLQKVQGQLITCRLASVGGDDTSTGTFDAPLRTIGELHRQTQPNDIGYIENGSFNEYINNIGQFGGALQLNEGTSHEDAPIIAAQPQSTVNWTTPGVACLLVRNDGFFHTWWGINFDASGAAEAINIFGQAVGGSGNTPKYLSFENCQAQRASVGANIFVNQGVLFTGTTPFDQPPTAIDYEQFHRFIDVESFDSAGTTPQGIHGFYSEGAYNRVEYCHFHDNDGDGGKNRHGSREGVGGVSVGGHNILRFCHIHDNTRYGWIISRGVDNIMDFNDVHDNGQSGLTIEIGLTAFGGERAWCCNNIVARNGALATGYSDISIQNLGFGPALDMLGPIYVFNNVCYQAKEYGFHTFMDNTASTVQNLFLANNVFYLAAVQDKLFDPGTIVAEDTNNHVTSDGDPRFTDPGNGDFRLAADSPLVDGGVDRSTFIDPRDYEGNLRPFGTGWDIGAFELVANSEAPDITMSFTTLVTKNIAEVISMTVVDSTNNVVRITCRVRKGLLTAATAGSAIIS